MWLFIFELLSLLYTYSPKEHIQPSLFVPEKAKSSDTFLGYSADCFRGAFLFYALITASCLK